MNPPAPTRRPTDLDRLDGEDPSMPATLLHLPWIDPHNHAHTLSWSDREAYALSGCVGMVMVASGSHWTPYRPVRPEDVRFLWDQALDRRAALVAEHGFDARLSVGVQTGVRVEGVDELLVAMDGYCAMDEVVAVGEIGVRPTQQGEAWPLAEQRAAIEGQAAVADRHGLPLVLHTPSSAVEVSGDYRPGVGIPGYEKLTSLSAEPVLEGPGAALEAVRLDVEAVRDAGLPEDRVVASHADPEIAPFLAEETDCYLSYMLGNSWLTGVTAATVADAIEAYGSDRVMVETDCADVIRSDPYAVKRAVLELYRLGVDVDAIRRVVYENPRDVFGFGV